MYVIKIQNGCWVASWDGDPGRTLKFEYAKVFKNYYEANKTKRKLINENKHRVLNLKILDYKTAKREVE